MGNLLRIQPGEGRKTALMFGTMMCVVGSFITGRVARDSLFLSRYSVDYLPYLYIWVALGVSIQSYLYSRIADRFRRDRTVGLTFICVIIAYLAARVSMYWAGDWFYPVLYVYVELAGSLLIIQTWTLANDIFTTREAKRLFALVGGGGVISAVVVGFSVRGLVKLIGTEDLLYLSTLLLTIGLLLITRTSRVCREEILSSLTTETRGATRTRIALFSDWARLFANKHLVLIAGLMLILGFVITFVDYQFKIAARAAYLNQEEQLAGFFGLFWAVTGALSCLIQFFLTGRILERFGVLLCLLLLPLALMVGTVAFLIAPILWSATLLKGSDSTLRYTVNDATMQLLYTPVPSHFRGRAKAFIDGIIRPVSIGLSGAVLAWVLPSLPPDAFGWILLTCLLGWLLFAYGTRRQYLQSLMHTLQTRRLHFGEVNDLIPDQAAARILRQALEDPDEQNVLHALEMTRYCKNVDWNDDLVRLSSHQLSTIRARVLRLLGAHASLKNGPLVFERLHDRNPEVRTAAVEAYCAIGRARAIRVIARFLDDPHREVRAAAVVGLIRWGGLDGVLSSAERLKKMLDSEDPKERATGAEILGDIGVKNFYHPLLSLLTDSEIPVRLAAIKAAGKMGSQELLPALVYRIEDPTTRNVASEALAAFGTSAVRLLSRVLANPEENPNTRLAVPAILARIGDQAAMDVLFDHIDDPDEDLRTRVLESIHRFRLRRIHLEIPRDRIRKIVLSEIRNLYEQWFVLLDLEPLREGHLLVDALKHRHKLTTKRIFHLLGCLWPVRTIDTVYNNLSAPLRRARSNAIEVLDNLLDKKIKRLLIPLLDKAMQTDCTEVGAELFGLERQDLRQRLHSLMEEQHAWLTTCAIFTAGQIQAEDLGPDVLACTASNFPLVRETALLALDQILPKDKLRSTLTRHIKDPSSQVRRYATWLAERKQIPVG
jgi:ATP/ADP translocase/HEAT repeat protein